jgi:glutathione S-transferase
MDVFAALNLKNIDYDIKPINLLKGEQLGEKYGNLNPTNLVPTLVIDNNTLNESIAIMEYLEVSGQINTLRILFDLKLNLSLPASS